MKRYSITIAGMSGQGVDSMGKTLAKALKRCGFKTIAYREYPSLIKGGHAVYTVQFANEDIFGVSNKTDCVVVLNKQDTQWHLGMLNEGGIIIHDIKEPKISTEDGKLLKEKNINMCFIPALAIAKETGGNILMANVAELGFLWKLLGLPMEVIEKVLSETFAHKEKLIEPNINVLRKGAEHEIIDWNSLGYQLHAKSGEGVTVPAPDKKVCSEYFQCEGENAYADDILLSGNEAIALGAIQAGVRAYFAYPMTPSSSILATLAATCTHSGMVIKQAEDEISAAGFTIGASFAGTRAMTGTSGGGFDLMSEHVSLSGILESPFVCVIAQRPGPATGLPTWTNQGDLLLAIFAGHGEFPRIVLGCSDVEDCFSLTQHAHNLAEEFQTPVLILTDKMLAESLYSVPAFTENTISINRGLTEKVTPSAKRYEFTTSGISPRWLPGTDNPDYDANSDEHNEYGDIDEGAENAVKMMDKRMRKNTAILASLPDPKIYTNGLLENANTRTFIGWGSVKGAILDTMSELAKDGIPAKYMHISYLWPLKKETIEHFLKANPNTILVENNATGQLGKLLTMEMGLTVRTHLKYDGRPFFLEELREIVDRQS